MANAWGKLSFITSGEDKEPVILTKAKFVIGRAKECDLIVLRKRVSTRHCYLEMTQIGGLNGQKLVYLHDTSTNGTLINGMITLNRSEQHTLKSGDSFKIGHDRNVRETGVTLRFDSIDDETDQSFDQTEEYVLDVDGVITGSNGDVATESKGKNEEEAKVSSSATKSDEEKDSKEAEKKANEEMLYNLMCTICHEVFYKCVVLQPCVHCFCGGCYSDWMARSNECPQCRTVVQQIAPNHTMNNVVKSFLRLNPGSKRDQSDLDEQDKKNKITRVMAFPMGLKRFYPFDEDYNEDEDDDYDYETGLDDYTEEPLEFASDSDSALPDMDDDDDRNTPGSWDDYDDYGSATNGSPPPLSPPISVELTPSPTYGDVTPTYDDVSSVLSGGSHRSNVISISDDAQSAYSAQSHRSESSDHNLSSPSSVCSIGSFDGSFSSSDSDSVYGGVDSDSSLSASEDWDDLPKRVITCRQCPLFKRSKRDRKRNSDSEAGPSNSRDGEGSSSSSSRAGHTNFACTREQVHLMCLCCKEFMPRRSLIENKDGMTVPPQSCSNCFSLFCHMYWGCRAPNCNGCLAPFEKLDFSNSNLDAIINNNRYETQILYTYLQGNGMDWMDLFKECLLRFREGSFSVLTSLDTQESHFNYDHVANRILCKKCGLKVFSELAYQYREDILSFELPLSVLEREDCYYGSNCRSQYKERHSNNF